MQYIVKSQSEEIRYKASSGGAGSTIIKYLFDTKKINTAISFIYDTTQYRYQPILIHSYKEYKQVGSIYHDINIVKYLSENITKIKGGLGVFCLPCQVNAIKSISQRNHIKVYIISLTCSGQLDISATYYLYKLLHIPKNDIKYMQYRGNGWPSGITIDKKDGSSIFLKNWSYPWTIIHSSQLFKPKRCFFCTLELPKRADFILADPWLKELKEDTVGHTLIIPLTHVGQEIFDELVESNKLMIFSSATNFYQKSQAPTIKKRQKIKDNPQTIRIICQICTNKLYKKIILKNILLVQIHTKCISHILSKL